MYVSLINILGFNNSSLSYGTDFAQVETVLLKITHKKRKDSSAPSMQISLGKFVFELLDR